MYKICAEVCFKVVKLLLAYEKLSIIKDNCCRVAQLLL